MRKNDLCGRCTPPFKPPRVWTPLPSCRFSPAGCFVTKIPTRGSDTKIQPSKNLPEVGGRSRLKRFVCFQPTPDLPAELIQGPSRTACHVHKGQRLRQQLQCSGDVITEGCSASAHALWFQSSSLEDGLGSFGWHCSPPNSTHPGSHADKGGPGRGRKEGAK